MMELLAQKASKSSVQNSLNRKVNKADLEQALGLKTDVADLDKVLELIEQKPNLGQVEKLLEESAEQVSALRAEVEKVAQKQVNALRQWDKTIADLEANTSYCLNEMRQSVLDSLQKKADYLLVEKLHQKVGAKPDHEQMLKEVNKVKVELNEEVTRRVQGCVQDIQ